MVKTKENTRNKILKNALKLFNNEGAFKITTNHIIADIEISPGTLYYYFGNKEEIIRAHFEEITQKLDLLYSQKEGFSLSVFISDLEKLFEVFYEYRYIYLNIVPLFKKDPVLAKSYQANFGKKRELLELYMGGFIENNLIREDLIPMLKQSPSKDLFLESMWTITDFYFSFQHSLKSKITKKDIYRGVAQVLLLMKPWVNEEPGQEIDRYLNKGNS